MRNQLSSFLALVLAFLIQCPLLRCQNLTEGEILPTDGNSTIDPCLNVGLIDVDDLYSLCLSNNGTDLTYNSTNSTNLTTIMPTVSTMPSLSPSTMPPSTLKPTMTRRPTPEPTASPSFEPSPIPTTPPTPVPTKMPTQVPTQTPTRTPTKSPTLAPTDEPTPRPTEAPLVKRLGGGIFDGVRRLRNRRQFFNQRKMTVCPEGHVPPSREKNILLMDTMMVLSCAELDYFLQDQAFSHDLVQSVLGIGVDIASYCDCPDMVRPGICVDGLCHDIAGDDHVLGKDIPANRLQYKVSGLTCHEWNEWTLAASDPGLCHGGALEEQKKMCCHHFDNIVVNGQNGTTMHKR